MRRFGLSTLIGLSTLSACATAIVGEGNSVKFTSIPSGAIVVAKDVKRKAPMKTCITPCELILDRRWPHNVTFEKDNYVSQKLMLTPKIDAGQMIGGAISNSLTFGIGDAIDGPNAYYNDLRPNPLHAILEPREVEPLKD